MSLEVFATEVVEGEVVIPDLLGTSPADLIQHEPPLPPVTADEARADADWIHANLATYVAVRDRIGLQYRRQDWKTLGYDSWFEFLDREYGNLLRQLVRRDRMSRVQAVHDMRSQGMSTRQIAERAGVSHTQVNRDLGAPPPEAPSPATQVERNVPPELRPNASPAASGAVAEAPEKVTGKDGKEYPARRPSTQDKSTEEKTTVSEWSEDEEQLRELLQSGGTAVVSLRANHANLVRWAEEQNLLVRIDRRTEWGNPFEMPGDGDRDAVIRNYSKHYLPFKLSLHRKLPELRGKALACWCAPEPCHGDVLVGLLLAAEACTGEPA